MSTSTIWTRFQEVAKQLPEQPAIVQGDRTWTFSELGQCAEAFAGHVAALGLRQRDRILFYLENRLEMAAALLGAWAYGTVPVLVHATAPATHVEHAAELTQSRLIVIDSKSQLLPDFNGVVLNIETSSWRSSSSAPTSHIISADPASIVFTSGSTGLPKGVTQSHYNLLLGCETVATYLGYRSNDKIVCPIPWTFDYGFGQLLSTLCRGLMHILPEAPNPFGLCAAIKDHRPTVLPGIPSWFAYLLRGVSPFYETDISSIRIVTNTGGTVPSAILNDLLQAFSNSKIFLNYGMTETYRSTYLDPALVREYPNSIGNPMPGVDVVIVREDGTLADPGEIGELVHRGNCICLGYWGNPEQTAQAIRPDPVWSQAGFNNQRALFTGDLGHKDEAGFIYFKARKDHMIKSMGVRVSPGEIEDLLHHSGLVRNVAVIGLPHEMAGEWVVAAIEPIDDRPVEDIMRALKVHARTCMSPHMRPQDYIFFDVLPKTHSGKNDYQAIRRFCADKSGSFLLE